MKRPLAILALSFFDADRLRFRRDRRPVKPGAGAVCLLAESESEVRSLAGPAMEEVAEEPGWCPSGFKLVATKPDGTPLMPIGTATRAPTASR